MNYFELFTLHHAARITHWLMEGIPIIIGGTEIAMSIESVISGRVRGRMRHLRLDEHPLEFWVTVGIMCLVGIAMVAFGVGAIYGVVQI